MNENNQKHIDILQTCVKQFDLKAAIREYDKSHLKIATIPIRFDEALAAMQVLQNEIDALKLREEKLMQDINDQAERNRPDWDSDSDSPSHYGYNW